MKKIFGLLGIFAIVLTGCSGSDGRDGLDGIQGPQGPPGIDGDGASALIFETTQNLIYNEGTGLRISDLVYFTDNNITPLATDVALAYRLERTTDEGEDIWVPLPHNFFLEQGTLQYLFNFSVNGTDENNSVEFVMDGDFELTDDNLDPGFYNDQTFRVVLIPTEMAADFTTNSADLNAVMKSLNLSNDNIQQLR